MGMFADFLGRFCSQLARRGRPAGRRAHRPPGFIPRLASLEARVFLPADAALGAEPLAVFGSRGTDGLIAAGLLPDVAPASGVTTGIITLKSVQSGAWSDANVWQTVNPDGNPGVNRLPQ